MKQNPLALATVNHVLLVCDSLQKSITFYSDVLGFVSVPRPGIDTDGAWLCGYGIGIHLLQSEEPGKKVKKTHINPGDHHVGFETKNLDIVDKKLLKEGIPFLKQRLEEGEGGYMDQIFFHDPDGLMIEICDIDNLHPSTPTP